MSDFIKHHLETVKEQWVKRIRGCEAECPCCKRLCDVNHSLDKSAPIGAGENRHRCQTGHQMRGMGDIRYEVSNEASMECCENIKDNDPIVNKQGLRRPWKDFKGIQPTWDFGDTNVRENQITPYAYIWNRIGRQLCQHFGNGMIVVTKNTPVPINHFILVLDRSGSMISKPDKTNLSPWEHLLQAVKEFIRVRNERIYFNDQLTLIVFGSRALRVCHREKINNIDIDRINMISCGGSTSFRAAFQTVIETLEEIRKDSTQVNLQQTIVFMTDGQPDSYPTVELEQLSTEYSSMIANFWTMGLGDYDKQNLQKVNTTMKGELKDIQNPENLPEAYAEIADF